MPWEFDVLYWFQSIHNSFFDIFWPIVTLLGAKGLFCILTSVLMLIFIKDKRVGLTCMAAWVINVLITNVAIKPIVMRDRPCWIDPAVQLLVERPDDYSFPSGHTAIMFCWAMSIVQYSKKWGAAAIGLALLVAFSRLYLFVHFPTDVIAGAVCGTIAAFISGFLVRKYWPALEKKLESVRKKEK